MPQRPRLGCGQTQRGQPVGERPAPESVRVCLVPRPRPEAARRGGSARRRTPRHARSLYDDPQGKLGAGGFVSTTSTSSSIETLVVTDVAASKVGELLEEEGNPELFL